MSEVNMCIFPIITNYWEFLNTKKYSYVVLIIGTLSTIHLLYYTQESCRAISRLLSSLETSTVQDSITEYSIYPIGNCTILDSLNTDIYTLFWILLATVHNTCMLLSAHVHLWLQQLVAIDHNVVAGKLPGHVSYLIQWQAKNSAMQTYTSTPSTPLAMCLIMNQFLSPMAE